MIAEIIVPGPKRSTVDRVWSDLYRNRPRIGASVEVVSADPGDGGRVLIVMIGDIRAICPMHHMGSTGKTIQRFV